MVMRARMTGLACLFLCLGRAVLAESPTAAIVGSVFDLSGGSIEGAVVRAASLESGVERATHTNRSGAYRIGGLPAGEYDIVASFPQFKTIRQTRIPLRVGEEVRVNLTLTPGDLKETVLVTGKALTGQTESITSSTVVDEGKVQELPLNGRQLQNLALLAPGVSAGWNWSTAANRYGKARENLEGAFVANGARGRSNNFILDGMPMNLRQYGVINFEPSVEAVREFEIKTSVPSAEFGGTMGATVNIVTRSGGSKLHGSAYEFFRNDKLDANDTFNNRAGLPRGKLRQNQFGASLGGPIYKEKHFFFGNLELLRNIEGVETRVTSVPTPSEAAGRVPYTDADGTARVLDLSQSITPLTKRLLEFYPQPNSSGPAGLNYNSSLAIALNDYQFHGRTDHYLSSKDIVTMRTSWNLNDQNYIVNRFGGPFIPGFSLPNPERTANGTLTYLRSLGANVLNEARFGFNRYSNDLGNGDPTASESIGLPNGNGTAHGIPSIVFTAGTLERLGGQPWMNREQNELTVFASDTLSYLRGNHNLKFGGEVTRFQYNTRGAFNQRGTISFDGSKNSFIPKIQGNERANVLADFLLGLPQEASIVVGQFGRGYRQWSYAAFAQDSWRATPRLTVDLGVRYDYSAPWTEVNGKLSNFVSGLGIVESGSPEFTGLYEPDHNNFGPRVGLAYDVTGNGRTVIRAGFAILYETLLQANSVELVENNPPLSLSAVTRSPTPFSHADAPSTTLVDLRNLARPSRSIAAVDHNGFRNPYTMQYSFSLQRALGSQWLLEAVYTGVRGVKLPLFVNTNQVPLNRLTPAERDEIHRVIDAGGDTTEVLSGLRPFPEFDTITVSKNAASSTYHGAQFKLERRLGSGLALLTAYTVSKSIDNASDFGSGDPSENVLDSQDLANQRGLSSFDIPQRFSAAFTYNLPLDRIAGTTFRRFARGWQMNGIVTLQSGQPFTSYTSAFDPFRNEGFNRPDIAGDPKHDVPPGHAFNPVAFKAPNAGTFGDAGRNIVRGDGYHSLDISLFRDIRVHENTHLQLRLEVMDALNHVNFQGPVTNLASTPGLFVASAPPRIVQLGAKISF